MELRKRLLKLNIVLFLISSLFIAGVLISRVQKCEIKIIQIDKRELLATSGTCGTCNWTIDNNGRLTIMVGTLANLTNSGDAPWYQHRSSIKTVHVNKNVKTNTNCVGLFYGLSNCTSINLENLDTTNSTTITHFFEGCSKLTSIAFPSSFIKTSVTSIGHMFKDCSSLTSINLSSFNTTNVTDLNSFFMGCGSLTSINWGSNFSTNNVKIFGNMFNGTGSLTTIGKAISTPKATNMSCMFANCSSLTSVNLSNFTTTSVTNMNKMFLNCAKITSLDLSTFNNSAVPSGSMEKMLEGLNSCNSIKLGANFRFKKSNTSTLQILGTSNYYWKNSSTVKTSLQLENITGDVAGTWVRQYVIEYYQGKSSSTSGATKIGTSYIACESNGTLLAYSSTSGTAPSGWTFYGWSKTTSGTTSISTTVSNAPVTTSVLKLYAIFKRTIKFNSGVDKATTSSVTQYYNPYNTSYITEVKAPKPSVTGLTSYGWSARGYRADTTAQDRTYAVTTSDASIKPAYNVGNSSTTVNLYAVYKRTLTMAYNGNGNTGGSTASHTLAQYYNTNGAKSSAEFTTSSNGFTKTGYSFSKWANGSASGTQVSAGATVSFSPAYDSTSRTKTMYAIWTAHTYKVEYYQGKNTTTAGATKLGTSNHTYGTAKNLTTYSSLGGEAPSGWTFYGWSANNGTTNTARKYTDGQSVNNLTSTNNGTIKIYAIFKRTIKFNSGVNKATTSSVTQYYNPYKTTGSITSVTAPAPSVTGLSDYGWSALGYRADSTATTASFAVTTSSKSITPAYNVGNTSTTVNLYAVYKRVLHFYSGLNKATDKSTTQYYNTNGNKVSAVTAPAPTSITNWTALGYRVNKTASTQNYSITSEQSFSPAYNVNRLFYAVYKRVLTIKYNGNGNTGGSTENTTKDIYLNTNSTTTSSQAVTLRNNGFTKTNYVFDGWNTSSSGTGTDYEEGKSYNPNFAYNASAFEKTLYATWVGAKVNFTIKHYVHNLGTDTYTLNLTETKQKGQGSTITLSSYKKTISGFTYVKGFKGSGNTTMPTSGEVTTTTVSANMVINLYYRRNYLYIEHDVNGGTLGAEHSTSYRLNNNLIESSSTGNTKFRRGVYGSTVGAVNTNTYEITGGGLVNYNNTDGINIVKSGYKGKTNGEWFILNGSTKTEYSQTATTINANDIAQAAGEDLAEGDVTITIYVNWVPNNYTVTFNADGGTVSPSSKSVTFDSEYGELPEPTKIGYTFNGWSRLPSGYREVEYIESTGTQYIDTGYKPTPTTGIKINFKLNENDTNQEILFGVRGLDTDSTSLTYVFYKNTNNNLIYSVNNGWIGNTGTVASADAEEHELKFNIAENSYSFDEGVLVPINNNATNNSNLNLPIMAYRVQTDSGSNLTSKAKYKLYSFEIYECGALVKKFIPCKNSTGTIGLYDVIGKQFYTNAGTGTFIAGQEKHITSGDIVEIPSNHTLIADWIANTYTIEYYKGNAELLNEPEEITKLGESTHTYGTSKNLTTYEILGGTIPQGWVFSGWSSNNGINDISTTYTNGQSVSNIISEDEGIVKLYAIFERNIQFNSGVNCSNNTTVKQMFNTNNIGLISSISAPVPSLVGLSDSNNQYGWSALGYRIDQLPIEDDFIYEVTTSSMDISIPYNTYDITNPNSTTLNLYGVYERDITIQYNGNGATSGNTEGSILQQIYNTSQNSVSDLTFITVNNEYIYTGHTFTNWAENNTGTQNPINASEEVTISGLAYNTAPTKILYAIWRANTYIIEYYKGNAEIESGEDEDELDILTKLGESTHTYDTAQNLTTYEILGGTTPQGWTFSGWSSNDGLTDISVTYTDGECVSNIISEDDGVVRLYAIFKRDIKFNSGVNCATTSILQQYFNTYDRNLVSEVLAPVPSVTGLSGWNKLGYRSDKEAHETEYEVVSTATNIKPGYNKHDSTNPNSTTLNLYAIYSRDLTMSYNGNSETAGSTESHTLPQLLNTSNNTVDSVLFITADNGYTKTGYTFNKWAENSEGTLNPVNEGEYVEFSPEYNSTALTKTMYAIWTGNTYIVEYYQGNNSTTEGATKIGESTHTYDTAQNLTTYSSLKTSSGKAEPQSWAFYGWSANNGTTATTRTYTDGQSVNNLTVANNGIIKLYAIFNRTIKFNSGLNCATTSTAEQRYNPYKTTGSITSVSAPSPSMTGLSDTELGWAPIGYRANKTAGEQAYAVTISATNITPAYNVYDVGAATSTTVNLYAVYSRTITLYHGLNKAQNSTTVQYMNTSGNTVSNIIAPAPSVTGLSDYGWEASGYRADTEAIDVMN